jgi:beta-galactosidase
MVKRRILLFMLVCFLPYSTQARETIPLDLDWQFFSGEFTQAKERTLAGAKSRRVDLPHDWSIEGKTSADEASQGDGGYFPTGVGWYRKELTADASWKGKKVWLEFDGVAPQCEVWFNGKKVGGHHYAYTPFRIDLTDHIEFDKRNSIAVRVDNSHQPNSRWYTGSGIYRHVRLVVVDPVHIDAHSIRIDQSFTDQEPSYRVSADVVNESNSDQNIRVEVKCVDQGENGRKSTMALSAQLKRGTKQKVSDSMTVTPQSLWSPTTPNLQKTEIRLYVDEELVDELITHFGLRKVELAADKGLLINGEQVELVGACIHHDNGPLGAAAFDRAEERRVELLKEAGFNAIRTSHNPPSPAFLDACDRLGMLVIDEAFDGWAAPKKKHDYSTVFADKWQSDLRAMIDRDRHHASVIMWSIGNEVFERGNEEGKRIAAELAAECRKLDPTRPVAIALNGLDNDEKWPKLDPVFALVDAAGYNYQTHQHAKDHKRLPKRVMFCSETYPLSAFEGWEASEDNSYMIGDFVWTGIDYLGEAGIGRVFKADETMRDFWEESQFPWHGGACGDLDITGVRKPLSHYRRILWDRGEKLALAVEIPSPDGKPWQLSKWAHPPLLESWTWPGQEGKPLKVEVFSRHPSVRLYLNDKLIDEQPTTREQEFRATFEVPYASGTLKAVGVEDGKAVVTKQLVTAGPLHSVRLTADRKAIRADRQDLSFVTVEVIDAEGNLCPNAEHSIEYKLDGPATIAAVGSGDLTSRASYQANPRRVYQGRGLVVVRSGDQDEVLKLTATAEGLESDTISIETFLPK